MFDLILRVLGAGLELWASKEKHKYIDEMISLKKAYYEEWNKPLDRRSDVVLDNINFKLRLLCDSFVASAGSKNVADQ